MTVKIHHGQLVAVLAVLAHDSGRKHRAGDLEMAPGLEGGKPSGKGLVNHPVIQIPENRSR
jgi:hypothetical protein